MSQSTHSNVDENEEIVSAEFCAYVKVNLLREKNAYLLKQLLENVINLCEEHNNVPFINDVKSLRRYLEKDFKDQIGFFNLQERSYCLFFNSGRKVIVYSADANLCQYVASMFQGLGLQARDLVKTISAFPEKRY